MDGLIALSSYVGGLAIASILPIGGLILLMEGLESSSRTTEIPQQGSKVALKGKNKEEDKTTVNLSYVLSRTSTGLPIYRVYDQSDPTSTNLKRLYPGVSAKVVGVPEIGVG